MYQKVLASSRGTWPTILPSFATFDYSVLVYDNCYFCGNHETLHAPRGSITVTRKPLCSASVGWGGLGGGGA